MKRFFYLLIATLAFVACNENAPEGKSSEGKSSEDKTTDSSISCDPAIKTVTSYGGTFVVTVTSKKDWTATSNQTWVSLSPNSGQGDAFVTVTVSQGIEGSAKVLFSNGDGSATLTIERKALYQGELPGEFSVSETLKVRFSKGNLRYHPLNKKWAFAEHQWEVVGDDNTKISDTYNGWIDLFGWGTGNNPTLATTTGSDYSTFVDWGTNKISNGGDSPDQWRTLSKDEWLYIIEGRPRASSLFGVGRVCGVDGLILLPDEWMDIPEIAFNSGLAPNSGNNGYETVNDIALSEWSRMEQAGAVFLPTEKSREGTTMDWYSGYGNYWSTTHSYGSKSWSLCFYSYMIVKNADGFAYFGDCVRLVR